MTSCIFCKIVAGEIPSERVLENDHALAFLDVTPLTRGHVLVVPKEHRHRVADMLPHEAADVMLLVQEATRRQAEALGAGGATVAANDGRAAGQEVLHVHVHVLPRQEGDGFGPIHALFSERPELRKGELQEIAVRLRG